MCRAESTGLLDLFVRDRRPGIWVLDDQPEDELGVVLGGWEWGDRGHEFAGDVAPIEVREVDLTVAPILVLAEDQRGLVDLEESENGRIASSGIDANSMKYIE
jgi:hypothetical protein